MVAIFQQRKRTRLKEYDYSNEGAYFITICAQGRKCLFGLISDGEMRLNEYGKILINYWNELPYKWPNVSLDYFAVMPNHVHGIIMIVGAGSPRPLIPPTDLEGGETPPLQKQPSLSAIIGYFKYQSARLINEQRGTPGAKVWQRSFYEHVIRDDESLNRIREYIDTNPKRWTLDRENPDAEGKDDFDCWLATFKASPNIGN